MNLDNWRALNYIFQDLIVTQLFLVTGYVFYLRYYIPKRYFPIIYYLFGSAIFEVTSKVILKINENSNYFTYSDLVFILMEDLTLYWFILNIFPQKKNIKIFIFTNVIIILGFFVYLIIAGNSVEKAPILPAILNILLLLYFLFLLNIKFSGKKIIRIPEIIICLAFLLSYLVLIIVFFIKPSVIDYSRIMANQLIIINHIISIMFYFVIGYGLSLKKNKI
jgi:hypothetical protein